MSIAVRFLSILVCLFTLGSLSACGDNTATVKPSVPDKVEQPLAPGKPFNKKDIDRTDFDARTAASSVFFEAGAYQFDNEDYRGFLPPMGVTKAVKDDAQTVLVTVADSKDVKKSFDQKNRRIVYGIRNLVKKPKQQIALGVRSESGKLYLLIDDQTNSTQRTQYKVFDPATGKTTKWPGFSFSGKVPKEINKKIQG